MKKLVARISVSLHHLAPALCIGLVACQASPGVPPSSQFQLGPNATGTTAHGGTITINLTGVLQALRAFGKYHTLATTADVDHLIITLSMPGQPNLVQVVTASQIIAGQSSVIFAGLPTGTVTIAVVAYNAYGGALGSASQSTSITNGQNSNVNMSVPIDPSASPASTGSDSVGLNASFTASPSPPPSGTVVATFANCNCFYADNAGRFYGERMAAGSSDRLIFADAYSTVDGARVSGQLLEADPITNIWELYVPIVFNHVTNAVEYIGALGPPSETVDGISFDCVAEEGFGREIAVNAAGDTYYTDPNGGVIDKATSGDPLVTTIPLSTAFTIDSNDDFWSDQSSPATTTPSVSKYDPSGTPLGVYPLAFTPKTIKADTLGGVWVTDCRGPSAGTNLAYVSASGSVSAVTALTVDGYCVDANNHAWVATGSSLVVLATDGTTLATYPIAASNVAFGNGYIFANIGAFWAFATVEKIQP